MTARAGLSIVVCSRDRPELLAGCLDAIRRAMGPDDELVVVDSASVDPRTRDVAASAGADVVVRSEVGGLSVARNLGWRAASREFVAFTDDDVRVEQGWCDAMVAALTEPGGPWFATGWVGLPDDSESKGLGVALSTDDDSRVFDGSHGLAPGHGASMGFPRRGLEVVGGFDEHLGAGRFLGGADDADVMDRFFSAGYRARYDAAIRARHLPWRSRAGEIKVYWTGGKGGGARAAKVWRYDRSRFRPVFREVVLRWGVRCLVDDVKGFHEFSTVVDVAKLAGIVTGFAVGTVTPVRRGHYRPRRDRYAPAGARRAASTSS